MKNSPVEFSNNPTVEFFTESNYHNYLFIFRRQRLSMEKKKIEVSLPESIINRIEEIKTAINNNIADIEDYYTSSNIIDGLVDTWQEDKQKEHVSSIIRHIDTLNADYMQEERKKKVFRIMPPEYDLLIGLKQSINKYNNTKIHDTIKISDVIMYLVYQYGLDVEMMF